MAGGAAAAPALGFDPVFTDHAVLQRGRPLEVWGQAPAKAKLTVEIAGQSVKTAADKGGHWRARFQPLQAGGPYELKLSQDKGESRVLFDVAVGDVFLCSGQSNMEFAVRQGLNAETEINAGADPNIRLLMIPRISKSQMAGPFEAAIGWKAAAPDVVRDFSAACWFMGRELQRDQKVPIGLIDASWGGTPVQSWTSAKGLHALGGFDQGLAVMADYDRDPKAAEARWTQVVEDWFQTHDPDWKASQAWSRPDFDDAGWPKARLGGFWEGLGVPALADFDGVAWFRTHVTLTAAQAAQAATLTLGPVDDMDTSWVNGTRVGGMEGWDTPRRHPVPAGLLHAGDNAIAVRVLDTGGGGGLWGGPETRTLQLADGSAVPLPAEWSYRVSSPVSTIGGAPHAPWLAGTGLTALYNGMISPLGAYGLRGAAWYQGEANVGEGAAYQRMLAQMFADWRAQFGPDLPFLIVQLADFGPRMAGVQKSSWAELREAQRRAVAADPHAALAVAIDVGEPTDIHPANKQAVGHRLALAARKLIYGEAITAFGPRPVSARLEGDWVAISFSDLGAGLKVYSSDRPIGFELCDAARHCGFAHAVVEGDKVLLAAPADRRAAVRFCWADSPVCNLYNSEGLPAEPFELEIVP
jgi:sialate O-acetylesterase